MVNKSLNIGIIGAGIGGLALAIALKQKGQRVTIFEKSKFFQNIGSGLQISPNGMKVLRELGLEQTVEKLALKTESILLKNGFNGKTVGKIPLGLNAKQRFSANFFQIHRADLIEVLVAELKRLKIKLRMDTIARVKKSLSISRKPIVIHEKKESEFDVIIGADGIHSLTRLKCFNAKKPKFLRQVAYRGTVPIIDVPSLFLEPSVQIFLGPGMHVVCYPLPNRSLVNFIFCKEQASWLSDGWSIPGKKQEVINLFQKFEPLKSTMEKLSVIHKWGLFGYENMGNWVSGRIVLMGDACHPMLPYLSQGANQALEDALSLSHYLSSQLTGTCEDRLKLYFLNRANRVSRVQTASMRNAWAYHLRNPVGRPLAHLGLKTITHNAPNFLLSRFDWLYGYENNFGL